MVLSHTIFLLICFALFQELVTLQIERALGNGLDIFASSSLTEKVFSVSIADNDDRLFFRQKWTKWSLCLMPQAHREGLRCKYLAVLWLYVRGVHSYCAIFVYDLVIWIFAKLLNM